MLPAAHRLRSAADFSDTTRRGAKGARGRVVVYLDPPPPAAASAEPARAGLVVGRAVGGSVRRHRAARRLRGALAPLMAELPAGSRVVVRALAGADTDPGLAADLRQALNAALDRARRRSS